MAGSSRECKRPACTLGPLLRDSRGPKRNNGERILSQVRISTGMPQVLDSRVSIGNRGLPSGSPLFYCLNLSDKVLCFAKCWALCRRTCVPKHFVGKRTLSHKVVCRASRRRTCAQAYLRSGKVLYPTKHFGLTTLVIPIEVVLPMWYYQLNWSDQSGLAWFLQRARGFLCYRVRGA